MLAVIFVLAATLTLLPAVLAKLGPRSTSWRSPGRTPASTARRASNAGASGCGASPCATASVALAILVGLALPVTQLRTAMPSIKVVPTSDSSRIGYNQVQAAFGPGADRPAADRHPVGQRRDRAARSPAATPAWPR